MAKRACRASAHRRLRLVQRRLRLVQRWHVGLGRRDARSRSRGEPSLGGLGWTQDTRTCRGARWRCLPVGSSQRWRSPFGVWHVAVGRTHERDANESRRRDVSPASVVASARRIARRLRPRVRPEQAGTGRAAKAARRASRTRLPLTRAPFARAAEAVARSRTPRGGCLAGAPR